MISFSYFSYSHFINLFLCLVIGLIIITIPNYHKINIKKFGTIVGYFILFLKFFETLYRIKYEKFSISESTPLHFCNFTIIICALFLILKSNILFNICYFFCFGAFFALILPGVNTYETWNFLTLFMVNHAFVIITVLYGFIWLKQRPNSKGMIISIITVLILFIISYFYNNKYGTNFMFLKEYIAPFFKFIKPFNLYISILIFSFILIIFILYIPFRKNKKIEEI